MSQVSEKERASIYGEGKCPDCQGQLIEGPRGGDAQHVACGSCGSKFWVGYPFPPKRIDGNAFEEGLLERPST